MMLLRHRLKTTLVILFTWVPAAFAEVYFIPLNHVPPQDIIPIVKPFLKADDSLVAGRNELILRTDAQTLSEVKKIVRKYDQAAVRLMIYVRTTKDREQYNRGAKGRIDATIGTHSNNTIRGRAKIYSNRDQQTGNSKRFIQVLEGRPAYISYGRRTPYADVQVYEGSYEIYLSSTTRFHEATSGFTVIPRLVGDQVQLSIEPWSTEINETQGAPQTISSASTEIRGELGTWMVIGGQSERNREQNNGLLSRQVSTRSDEQQIEVKVSRLPMTRP